MQKIKQLIAGLALILVPLMPVGMVHAQAGSGECLSGTSGGIETCLDNGAVTTDPEAEDTDPTETVNNMIRLVINIFSLIVGVISVIMIIIGGLKYITSGGDSGNVSGAKNTILYAIIGLVVVALAQVIVRFVLQSTAGAE